MLWAGGLRVRLTTRCRPHGVGRSLQRSFSPSLSVSSSVKRRCRTELFPVTLNAGVRDRVSANEPPRAASFRDLTAAALTRVQAHLRDRTDSTSTRPELPSTTSSYSVLTITRGS